MCKIILSPENNGFSSGNNIGIKQAISDGCEYVLLLNNDTVVDKYFLTELVNVADNNPHAGIVTGDILYYYAKNKLWYSAGDYNLQNGDITMVSGAISSESKEISFACGCLMLIRRTVFEDIGLFDESFFLYTEDTDYCCKAQKAGWKIIWTNRSKIYHKVSASSGDISPFQQYYQIRNDLFVAKKYIVQFKHYFWKRLFVAIKTNIKFHGSFRSILLAYVHYLNKTTGKVNIHF